MSETSLTSIDYSLPRTVWVLGLQLFYTFLAMFPIYYYIQEFYDIRVKAEDVVIFLPIVTAILLYFIQIQLNDYFWVSEKIYKRRDSLNTSIKSFLVVMSVYYFIFLFFFGYFLNDTETYQRYDYNNEVSKLIAENIISLVLIYFLVVLMLNIQNQRFQQIWRRRAINRRK